MVDKLMKLPHKKKPSPEDMKIDSGESFINIAGRSNKTITLPNGNKITIRNCGPAKIYINVWTE